MIESLKESIKSKIHEYQITLRKLIGELPKDKLPLLLNNRSPSLATGHAEVWFCSDGCLVAIKNGFSKEITYSYHECSNQSMVNLYNKKAKVFFVLHDLISKGGCPSKPLILSSGFSPITNVITLAIPSSNLVNLLPKFSKIIFIGAEHSNSNWPLDHGTFQINIALESLNITGKDTALRLISEFKSLLDSNSNEEQLQVFLSNHPELIFPEFAHVIPKPKLGEMFIADFAFSIKKHTGVQWIFVEIEKPKKKIFAKSGNGFQFHSDFTQAKNQLLEWDSFISENLLYIKKDFEGLIKPQFLLIYGRNSELDEERRRRIVVEFNETSNRSFLTYDDIEDRFESIIKRLIEGNYIQ